ncbi:DHH family phosphoesterase [Pyrococcus abyssi]|uniref:DHH family phosphohydrolase n=1 Tax=Pyrococcus abyssi (strain GE5 / Orsay) TaxID=272844 RepID=Q9UYJ6_PYRAB|nr:bifunctional oligoribonuclease/PAP phosphatase NrnA [Pyrococcus abyssi]CAB50416.1 Phosphoesterase, recJ-like, containing a DHHA1 domain [Pyrococcus abyssi GE5]CCE70965.1 TPA: DHH family phosphohydrolase [Pyrococcus abyssi GE5]
MRGERKLKNLLKSLKRDEGIILLCHHNADPDSLGSAIAFSNFLLDRGLRNVRIGVAQSIASYSRRLLKFSRVPIERNPKISERVVFIFDTSSLEQLEPIKIPPNAKLIVIDHHVEKENPIPADISVIDPKRTSTAEIVWELFKKLGYKDEDSAKVLLAAIISDTSSFRYANAKTFKTVSEILELYDFSISEVSQLVAPVSDENVEQSKRIAVLKACQRMEIHKVRKFIIVTSKVSAYEALACKVFLQLGADVAIVGSEKDGVRISARAKDYLVKKGLHLGKLMEKVGPIIGGSGGGHPGAAGANGKENLDEAIKFLVKEVQRFLKGVGDG